MAYFGGIQSEDSYSAALVQKMFAAVILLACAAGACVFALKMRAPLAPEPTPTVEVREKIVEVKIPTGTADVLVPLKNIRAGERLSPAMFKVESRGVEGFADKVLVRIPEIDGKFALSFIPADTLIFKGQAVEQNALPMNLLTARIPEGFRAVTIPVNAESGVEGWAAPGAHVDVVWSTSVRGKNMVSTIVENAQILSAERSTQSNPADENGAIRQVPAHITLMVNIKDAQKIQLAKTSGSLTLNLRGDSDSVEAGSETITVDRLLRAKAGDAFDESQGAIKMDGQIFQLRGGKLKPQRDEAEIEPRHTERLR